MEMHQVRYFLALCAEQNFTRAAHRCGVAQPSLTRAIRRLEQELGGSLFDRGPATSRPTALARRIHEHLAQIAGAAEAAQREAASFSPADPASAPAPEHAVHAPR